MAQVVIRNVDDAAIARLKARAARKGISLERELRAILIDAARQDPEGDLECTRLLRARLAGRRHSDSTRLIREDRDR